MLCYTVVSTKAINRHKTSCAYPVWDVVGDVCKDIFGCVHPIKDLILRQHIVDRLPLRQDRGHLQQFLSLLRS